MLYNVNNICNIILYYIYNAQYIQYNIQVRVDEKTLRRYLRVLYIHYYIYIIIFIIAYTLKKIIVSTRIFTSAKVALPWIRFIYNHIFNSVFFIFNNVMFNNVIAYIFVIVLISNHRQPSSNIHKYNIKYIIYKIKTYAIYYNILYTIDNIQHIQIICTI